MPVASESSLHGKPVLAESVAIHRSRRDSWSLDGGRTPGAIRSEPSETSTIDSFVSSREVLGRFTMTSANTDPSRITIHSNWSATLKKFLLVTIAVLSALSLASSAAAQASTFGQRQALESAKQYLQMDGFSRAGLIHQLESPYGDHFSHAEAVWGVDHAHANWNAEAVQAAKSYLHTDHFSRAGLIHQLESPYGDRFTHAQAVYGASVAYR